VSTKTATLVDGLPRVNLLPPEIHENREFKRLVTGASVLVALSIVGVGALYVHGKSAVQSAQDALAANQQKQATLQRELNKLQYVVTIAANTASAEAALTQARSTNVHWSAVMADLSATLPGRAWYTQVSMKESVPQAGFPAASAVPTTVGSITFRGFGSVHNDTATWLDSMSKPTYMSDPYLTASAEQMIGNTKVVQFNSTVNVNSSAIEGCDTPGVC
jgi:Tfp pilus assembly protein PilN